MITPEPKVSPRLPEGSAVVFRTYEVKLILY